MQFVIGRIESCIVLRDRYFFFFNDTATTEIYTLSLHDALPISNKQHVTRHMLYITCDQAHVIQYRSEERFSRNAETDIVCRLLLEKKASTAATSFPCAMGCARMSGRKTAVPRGSGRSSFPFFFFNDTATTEISPLPLPDALPI